MEFEFSQSELAFGDLPFIPAEGVNQEIYDGVEQKVIWHVYKTDTHLTLMAVSKLAPYRVARRVFQAEDQSAARELHGDSKEFAGVFRLRHLDTALLQIIQERMPDYLGARYIKQDRAGCPIDVECGVHMHRMPFGMDNAFPYQARQQALLAIALHNRVVDVDHKAIRADMYEEWLRGPHLGAFMRLANEKDLVGSSIAKAKRDRILTKHPKSIYFG